MYGELGLEVTELQTLQDQLAGDHAAETFGFAQLDDLPDERQRAVVSDQILSTADGVLVNLVEARLHERAYIELVGPNGRGMPDPDDLGEILDMHRLDAEMVGFFRAIGSVLDCLGGLAVGILRVPTSIQRADVSSLLKLEGHAKTATGDAQRILTRASTVFDEARNTPPKGWLEWVIEMRNAVVHRARQLRTWLPRPRLAPDAPQLVVPTAAPIARLARFEPHFRRHPWLPDMEALSLAADAPANWLPEPGGVTLHEIFGRVNRLVERMCSSLRSSWSEAASGATKLTAPVESWRVDASGPAWRIEAAAQFAGFEPNYPVPPITSIHLNPRDAPRAQIAELLRRRHLGT